MLVGAIVPYAGSTVPSGYLLCDGSAVSRTTYARLFSIIGTTYGAGDDSTTFNLPMLSGKVAIGESSGHALGTYGGSENVTLQESELPSHSHVIPKHGHGNTLSFSTPSLSHSITQPAFTYTQINGTTKMSTTAQKSAAYKDRSSGQSMSRSTNLAVDAHDAASCTKTGGVTDCSAFDTESTGGDGAHTNMMPYLSITYMIYTGN